MNDSSKSPELPIVNLPMRKLNLLRNDGLTVSTESILFPAIYLACKGS